FIFFFHHPATSHFSPLSLHDALPIFSDPNALFFYPSTLFLALLPADFAFSMHFVVHFAWAGVGTYMLARRWGQRRDAALVAALLDRKSTRLNSSHQIISYAVFCLKKK